MIRFRSVVRLLPDSHLAYLGAITSSLSIFSLLSQAMQHGMSTVFRTILLYYDKFIEATLGWATPYLEAFVRNMLAFMPVDLSLDPIWRHVVVLTSLYFMCNIQRLFSARRIAAGLYQLGFAVPIAVFCGVGAGISHALGESLLFDFATTAFPAFGTFLMTVVQGIWFATFPGDRAYRTWPDFGGSWVHFVGKQMRYGARQLVGGLLISIVLLIPLRMAGVTEPSLWVLFILVICLALYWLFTGTNVARRSEEGPMTVRLLSAQAFRVGRAMLITIGFVFAFLCMNAGLSAVGL